MLFYNLDTPDLFENKYTLYSEQVRERGPSAGRWRPLVATRSTASPHMPLPPEAGVLLGRCLDENQEVPLIAKESSP